MLTEFDKKLSNETENLLHEFQSESSDEEVVKKSNYKIGNKKNNLFNTCNNDINCRKLPDNSRNMPKNDYNSDSGVEDGGSSKADDEDNLDRLKTPTDSSTGTTKKRFGFSFKKHQNLLNIFKNVSKPSDKSNKPRRATSQIKKQTSSKNLKIPLGKSPSCPALVSKQYRYSNDSNDNSQTSDLGDSEASTPVSTISSTKCVEVPGLVGMHNLGNTCYFNAIMQCLSHIDIFAEYFGSDYFLQDVEAANSILKVQKKFKQIGVSNNEGQLTFMIGMTIKSLWNSNLYSLNLLQEVMDVIAASNKQYNVFEQQDALEFFMWIIDKIHEESTTATSKKKVTSESKVRVEYDVHTTVHGF